MGRALEALTVSVRTHMHTCKCARCVLVTGRAPRPYPLRGHTDSFHIILNTDQNLSSAEHFAATILYLPQNPNTLCPWRGLLLSLVSLFHGLLCLCLLCVFHEWLRPLKEKHQPQIACHYGPLLAASCTHPAPGMGEPGLLICCDRR